MIVDLETQLKFPRHIAVTSLRLDLILHSDNTKQCIIWKLTVSWEEYITLANKRKKSKYQELVKQCQQKSWKIHYDPIEVGCRGFAGQSLGRALAKIGIVGAARVKALKDITNTVLKTLIANTLKLSCHTLAKIIQCFKRVGSTQNRPHVGHPKKLSACAERHIQILSLKDRGRSADSIAAEIKGVGVSLLVLRPYATLYIKFLCMAVTPGERLFWRRYTRKPANSLLETCQQSTWITETMSYGVMRWRLMCLVPMASSMCGGDQVRSTNISASCLQSRKVVGMSWSGAVWVR